MQWVFQVIKIKFSSSFDNDLSRNGLQMHTHSIVECLENFSRHDKYQQQQQINIINVKHHQSQFMQWIEYEAMNINPKAHTLTLSNVSLPPSPSPLLPSPLNISTMYMAKVTVMVVELVCVCVCEAELLKG